MFRQTFREWINNDGPLGCPCEMFLLDTILEWTVRPATHPQQAHHTWERCLLCANCFTILRGGISSPSNAFCLWHSPKQDLLLLRQMWLESIMPFKQSLSKQPQVLWNTFCLTSFNLQADVRVFHHNLILLRVLWGWNWAAITPAKLRDTVTTSRS